MRRLIARLAAVNAPLLMASVLLITSQATAGDPWGAVDCATEPTNPQCVITVGTSGAPGGTGGTGVSGCRDPMGRVVPCFVAGAGWLAGDGCYYRPATGTDLSAAQALGGVPIPPGAWYVGVCGYPPVPGLTRYRIFAAPPGPQLLAAEAVRALRLPQPVIRVNPAPPAAQIVYLPTWVWLGPQSWGRRSATASVPGMSVTATATPVRLVLSTRTGTGEPVTVTCQGPGTPWTPGRDAAGPSPTCGHTFTRPGSYRLQVTVTWTVSWAGGGVSGSEPAMTTTAALTVTVVEEPALNVRPGVG